MRPLISQRLRLRRKGSRARKGSMVVFTALLMVALMAILAFSIDTGYIFTAQTQLDRSTDAAALAGAASLSEGTDVASDKVVEYLVRNPVGSATHAFDESQLELLKAQYLANHQDEFEVKLGHWDPDTRKFTQSATLPSAIHVSVREANLPLFFGRVLGRDNFTIQSEAVAVYQPRDIMLVLDLSGSMNDDSELKSIGSLGQEHVENNLEQIYAELEYPDYGVLDFEPKFCTVQGQAPANEAAPQITVEYRYESVYVTSTKPLSSVKLEYSSGNQQTLGGSGSTGTFSGEGPIHRVWVKSGENGEEGELFDFHPDIVNQVVIEALGLSNEPYPYDSGSWNDYVHQIKKSDNANATAGYQWKFGHLNLINYWLERKPGASQTADLWKVSAQPITAVKDAVDVFMDYIREVDSDDQVGLSVYNSGSGDGTLESGLSLDLDLIASLSRHRQAGHYHNYTNIGAGMEVARHELANNARPGAFKMIVVMTDGKANWANGGYDTTAARNYVLSEAYAAKSLKIPVVTISLGAGADVSLMNEVATISDGAHFNVPGNQTVAEYTEDLKNVFREIAKNRPLKLVK